MLTIIINFLSVVLISQSLQAEDSLFEKAVSAYDRQAYAESIAHYQQLIKQDKDSGHVYYNLGNAYFRDQQLGAAMASFLAAKRLMPRDPDVRANLDFVHSQIKDNLESNVNASFVRILMFWLDRVTAGELLNVFFFLVGFGFLLLVLAKKVTLFKEMKVVSWSVLSVALLVFIAYQISIFQDEVWGSVVKDSIEVRSSPGESSTLMFKLHEGAPFLVKAEEEGWVKILLSDTKKGWVLKKDILFFQ